MRLGGGGFGLLGDARLWGPFPCLLLLPAGSASAFDITPCERCQGAEPLHDFLTQGIVRHRFEVAVALPLNSYFPLACWYMSNLNKWGGI